MRVGWSLWQWAFLLAAEGILLLIILMVMWRILASIHSVSRSINGRVDQLGAEVRRSTIAETREAVRREERAS